MIVGLDTDVLVHRAVAGARHHRTVRRWVDESVDAGARFGLTQQVCFEFLHVVSDPRRFEAPHAMPRAVHFLRTLWTGREIVRVPSRVDVVPRLCELLERFELGRKRILDTTLAATLEAAGIGTLATFNGRDYEPFRFLEIVDPRRSAG